MHAFPLFLLAFVGYFSFQVRHPRRKDSIRERCQFETFSARGEVLHRSRGTSQYDCLTARSCAMGKHPRQRCQTTLLPKMSHLRGHFSYIGRFQLSSLRVPSWFMESDLRSLGVMPSRDRNPPLVSLLLAHVIFFFPFLIATSPPIPLSSVPKSHQIGL